MPVVPAARLLQAAHEQSLGLVARHRALLGDWHRSYDRLNQHLAGRWPLLSAALRVVLRLVRLGRMQAIQTQLNDQCLEEIEALTTQLRLSLAANSELERRVGDLEAEVARLRGEAGERENAAPPRPPFSSTSERLLP